MKIICPICGSKGHVQKRGNSIRVGHYIGYQGKTRIIKWHKIDSNLSSMVNNGNQIMVNNKPNSLFFSNKLEPRAGFDPATTALPRRCPTRLGYRGTYFSE